jgi:large subunit ribosomal protein L25
LYEESTEMDSLSLTLSPRNITGKKVRALRRQGVVPVHLYGLNSNPSSLQVTLDSVQPILSKARGNVPITISVEGEDGKDICFVRDIQRHPVTEELLHVDFLKVDVKQRVRAEVPVVLVGEPPAVRNLGGILLQPFSTLEVEALPLNMPQSFPVDVTVLEDFEASLRVSDITVSDEITILRGDTEMIARVVPPRIEEEAVVETEEEEGAEIVEGEEASEPPAVAESEE